MPVQGWDQENLDRLLAQPADENPGIVYARGARTGDSWKIELSRQCAMETGSSTHPLLSRHKSGFEARRVPQITCARAVNLLVLDILMRLRFDGVEIP